VTPLEHVPEAPAADVEMLGVAQHQPLHEHRHGCVSHLDKQVEVVRHQTISEEPEWFALLQLGQEAKEDAEIVLLKKDLLSAIPAGHDMEEGAWEMNAGSAGHIGVRHQQYAKARSEVPFPSRNVKNVTH
ncbi:MAG TPA: hypothetical protein VIJ38_07200, partial [Acidobacteriaceae bacterium]